MRSAQFAPKQEGGELEEKRGKKGELEEHEEAGKKKGKKRWR